MDVGFIGLGEMGQGMAQRLVDAGHTVTVWNRDPRKSATLASAGAIVAASPAQVASTGVVITMLANDAALEAVSFGKDGILSAGPSVVHISCSTVSVALTERLTSDHATVNQHFVAAPVLGRPDAAASGKLVILPAGDQDLITLCTPLFAAIGEKVLLKRKALARRYSNHIRAKTSILWVGGRRPAPISAGTTEARIGRASVRTKCSFRRLLDHRDDRVGM